MKRPAALALHRALQAWFQSERRELPWRSVAGPRDPYRVWLSEAMLQQTRVATVVDYFQRFLTRFPSIQALASATEAEVLAMWSGLGYYRRARNLHACAQAVVARYGGCFPSTRAELEALPGIGPYTAGAIASLAFDRAEVLVDGNVERVFARHFGLESPLASSALKREVWALALEYLPASPGVGAWNEGLMELGALVCTPRDPACERCPWAQTCVARATGRTASLPVPKLRPSPFEVELEVLCLQRNGAYLFQVRPEHGRMGGLWELPTRERVLSGASTRLYPPTWSPDLLAAGLVVREPEDQPLMLRHSITCHRIRAFGLPAELAGGAPSAAWAWRRPEEADRLGLTGLTRKFLRALERA